MPNVKKELSLRRDIGTHEGRLTFSDLPMDCLDGAAALAINTEWAVFRNPDFEEMKNRLACPVIFDGRNLYAPELMREFGFTYYSIGRAVVNG